jgi:O-antigen ligase
MTIPGFHRVRHSDLSWLLLVLALFGLSWGNLHRPVFLGLALLGFYQVLRHGSGMRFDPEIRHLAFLFGCIWLPMLASVPDAADTGRSLGTVGRYAVYFLAGVALLRMPWSEVSSRWLWRGAFILLSFWACDGLLQFFTGTNLLGYTRFENTRLTGMFDKHPRLGLMLSILSPLFFESVRQLSQRWRAAWLFLPPYLAVIFLGGSRVSWSLLVVSVVLYVWYLSRLDARAFSWSKWLWRGLAAILFAVLVFSQFGWLSERALILIDLASGDYQRMNAATSSRLPLWQAAWGMVSEHWLNGVGVRNYGMVFLQCCYEGQSFTDRINAHPHLFIGEVAAETGLLGVLGYTLFLLVLLRALIKDAPSPRQAWLMAGFLAAFPLSSSLAFYAIFSSSLLWLLLLGWLALERQAGMDAQ